MGGASLEDLLLRMALALDAEAQLSTIIFEIRLEIANALLTLGDVEHAACLCLVISPMLQNTASVASSSTARVPMTKDGSMAESITKDKVDQALETFLHLMHEAHCSYENAMETGIDEDKNFLSLLIRTLRGVFAVS